MDIIPNALIKISVAVWIISLIFAGVFLLRVLLAWLSSNLFSWLAYNLRRVTEPVVLQIRHQFGGRHFRFDLLPLVAGAMIVLIGSFASSLLLQLAGIIHDVIHTVAEGTVSAKFIARVLIGLLSIFYVAAILLRIFLPYFMRGYRNPILLLTFRVTEPLLKPLRKVFVMGMLDFAPFVALLIVQFGTKVLIESLS